MSDIALRDEEKKAPVWRQNLDRAMPEIKHLLPAHVTVDKFKRITANAIVTTPQLRQAMQENSGNVISELVKCATDGLVPDGREAALVPFNTDNGKMVTYMPMRQGVVKLIRQYPGVAGVRTRVVYENEEFRIEGGDREVYVHTPLVTGDRGQPIGVYAMIDWESGYTDREFMRADEIRKVQSVAKGTGKAIWGGKFGEEMWRKTVLKRLAKSINLSPEINQVLDRDNALYDMEKAKETPVPLADQLRASKSATESDEPSEPIDMGDVQTVVPDEDERPEDEGGPEHDEEAEAPVEDVAGDMFPGDAVKSPRDLATALWLDLQRVESLSTFDRIMGNAHADGRLDRITEDEEAHQRLNQLTSERRSKLQEKEDQNG